MSDAGSTQAAIEVRDLVVDYVDRRALDGVSLSVPTGAVVGLLGPNGSGKSTLLAAVAGLRTPQQGEVRVLGKASGPQARIGVGVVFQASSLDPLMTLHETLWLHGRLFGLGGKTLRQRVEELLEQFGLAERARDAVGTLSGGLRRRLELARALVPSPQVLLLDEPSTGLDPDSRRALWQQLHAARAAGLTLLLATNDVHEAERECDTVAFLHQGHLIAEGTPADLKGNLKHDAVRVECSDGAAAELAEAVASWPGVGRVTSADSLVHVTVDDVSAFVPKLFQSRADGIRAIRIEPSTLEDAYFAIAGAALSSTAEEA